MDEEEQEYDIYFQGSKEELFALLYPLSGPSSPIFDHLELNKIEYRSVDKGLQFNYNTKDFTNIDKQQEGLTYQSTALPTHSNYFYSSLLPENNAILWRSVTRMIEMRPSKVGNPSIPNQPPAKNIQEMENEIQEEDPIRELNFIASGDIRNEVENKIKEGPSQKLSSNWDISKEEYLARLCE